MRSTRFAAVCLLISTLIMCSAVGIGDCFACKTQYDFVQGCLGDPSASADATTTKTTYEHRVGIRNSMRDYRVYTTEVPCPAQTGKWQTTMTVTALVFVPWWGCVLPIVLHVPALLVTWIGPALVGLCTQIRKGLPRFARAPATVVAACNYEAHRLIYVAALVLVWVVFDVLTRRSLAQMLMRGPGGGIAIFVLFGAALIAPNGLIMLYGALGWIGPLRSDFTRMLIRSRWHAVRIVLMYAIGLPLLTVFMVNCIVSLVELAYL